MAIKIQSKGIKFSNYNYTPIMARFDNSPFWFTHTGSGTTQCLKACFKLLGQRYNAKTIEIREMERGENLIRFSYQCNKDNDYYQFYNDKDGQKISENVVF